MKDDLQRIEQFGILRVYLFHMQRSGRALPQKPLHAKPSVAPLSVKALALSTQTHSTRCADATPPAVIWILLKASAPANKDFLNTRFHAGEASGGFRRKRYERNFNHKNKLPFAIFEFRYRSQGK